MNLDLNTTELKVVREILTEEVKRINEWADIQQRCGLPETTVVVEKRNMMQARLLITETILNRLQ